MSNILLENYIKAIIEENVINELHVFDFDMTLYSHANKDWIQKTLNELKNSLSNTKVRVVLCTARSNNSEYILSTEKLLNQIGMSLNNFDYCYFKSVNRKENAPTYKSCVILDEVCANNQIKTVKFWDDRQDSLDLTGSKLKKYNNKINYLPVKC